jgi:2'-5' RNA ligase/GNAT superfamily N-acetyltransferase
MPRLRVGAALLVPPPERDEIDGLRRALGDPSLGRVPAHLTLVPPVNVRREDLGQALHALRAAAGSAPPALALRLGPPETFLPDSPVLYLAVGGDLEGLRRVRDAVFVGPLSRSLTWPFVPHVTLLDGADPSGMEAATTVLGGYRIDSSISRICLLQEIRGPAGRAWTVVADAFFGRPSIVGTGSPLALELVRSQVIDPEAAALLQSEGAGPAPGEPATRQLVVTARREGDVVGVAAARLTPDGGEIGVLVASSHRGQGIGTHLLAAVEAAVAEVGWGCTSLRGVGPACFYAARSRITRSGSRSTG